MKTKLSLVSVANETSTHNCISIWMRKRHCCYAVTSTLSQLIASTQNENRL